jgi:hypothetical protein
LIEKGFSGAEHRGRIAPMIRQDKLSWSKGRAYAMRGAPSKCPKGLDALSYAVRCERGQSCNGHDTFCYVRIESEATLILPQSGINFSEGESPPNEAQASFHPLSETSMKKLLLAVTLAFALAAGTAVVLTVQPQSSVAGSCEGNCVTESCPTASCVTAEPATPARVAKADCPTGAC